ncbi:hypothetical protein DMI65_18950 [Escherichia coli]|nr:hypothetical protein [Escherichia coli]
MKVSEINSKKVAILMKIDDINRANERWKKIPNNCGAMG